MGMLYALVQGGLMLAKLLDIGNLTWLQTLSPTLIVGILFIAALTALVVKDVCEVRFGRRKL